MKAGRYSEEQIIGILREAEAGLKTAEICRRHGIAEATLYIYGRLPRGKKVSGPVLTRIDCKHLSGVATKGRAQMGNPLTLSSTSGRPRGPLYRTGFECAGSIRQPIFRSFKQPRFPSRSGAIGFATRQHGPDHPCVLVGDRDRCTVITAPLAKLVDPKTS